VLLLAALTGVVLTDREHDIQAGGFTSIHLPFISQEVAREGQNTGEAGGQANRTSVSSRQASIPLRLIITSPVHQSGPNQPPSPTRLHATATLLAAPDHLASELCSLYAVMVEQGQQEGLTKQQVWSLHWQPLMDDICLLSTLTEATSQEQQSMSVITEAAHNLQQFFEMNSLPAWQEEVVRVLGSLQQQDAKHQPESPTSGGSATEQKGSSQVDVRRAAPAPGSVSSKTAATEHRQQHSPASSGDKAGMSSSVAGPSSPSKKKLSSAPGRTPTAPVPPRPTLRLRRACKKSLSAWVWHCCQLLWAGFPEHDDESEWQSDISVTCARATDPGGLICQAGICAANTMRAWRMGLLTQWQDISHLHLYIIHTLDWMLALTWWVGG
jgi:hypothetical protein